MKKHDCKKLHEEYKENKKKIRHIVFSFNILSYDGVGEIARLQARNDKIKEIFEKRGVEL